MPTKTKKASKLAEAKKEMLSFNKAYRMCIKALPELDLAIVRMMVKNHSCCRKVNKTCACVNSTICCALGESLYVRYTECEASGRLAALKQ